MKFFLKEKKKNRRFDRLIDFEKPNPLGIKWRFFLFSIILKNSSTANGTIIAITEILFIIVSIAPSFYSIFAISSNIEFLYSQEEAVFPYSVILSFITPYIIPTRPWIIICVIFCLVTIICFLICLYDPSKSLYLHVMLEVKIHLILLPLITGTIGYAIYILANGYINNIGLWYCIIPIFVYPFYLILISFLNFASMNSIVHPNPIIAGWFTIYPFWQPFVLSLISIIGYQCINWPDIAIYVLTSLAVIICIIIAIWVLITSPFLLFLSNEILATEMFVCSTALVLSVFFIKFDLHFANLSVAIIPIYSLLIFLAVHFAFQHRSASIQQILSQINTDLEQLTTDSLQATLSPLTHQISLPQLIKEGFLGGNKAVLSEVFLQYCLDCYPTSEWFIGYTAFLYGIIWKSDANAYRFLLHLLSLDNLSMPTEYILFQYVYCFMQTSQTLSPMIMRRLSKFRETVLKYVMAHKMFWLSAIKSEPKDFQKTKTQMFRLFLSVQHQAKVLEIMFPFCPSVCCELCLYEADLTHDIIKADQKYKAASSLLKPDSDYVTSTLFDSFMIFFPNARRFSQQTTDDQSQSNEYKFLSFQEHYDDAHRQGVSLNVNDTYISSLTHTFTMSRNQPQIDPKIDRIRLFFANFLIIFAIIVFVILFVFDHLIDPKINRKLKDIESLNDVLNATTHFRYDINRVQFDVDLLLNIANCTYSETCEDFNFFLFVLEHLAYTESAILSYKYKLDNFEYLNENTSAIDACSQPNCSFSYLFGILHERCLFFLNSNDVTNTSRLESIHDMNSIAESLSKVAENVYDLIFIVYEDKIGNKFEKTKTNLYILISVELFMTVVMSTITSLLLKRMKDNITDVIRTAQPPIIRYIASQFDKLLSFDKYQRLELSNYAYGEVTIPYVLMFLLLLVYPILSLCMIPTYTDFQFKKDELLPIIKCTEETQFLYYSLAKLEYSTFSSRNAPVSTYESIVRSEHSCFHSTFSPNESGTPVKILTNSKYIRQGIIAAHIVLLVLSIVVFIFFLRSAYLEINVVKIGRLLLKFIPSSAAQSNPVFAKLLRGQIISKNDISEFIQSIKIQPEDLSFFCILYYDFNGRITHSIGDVVKYLTIEPPATINDLANFILEKGSDDISFDEINHFFVNQTENETLNVSLYPGHEISIIFSKNPDSVVIKDDSSHYEVNSRLRMTKRLNKALENSNLTNLKMLQKVVITMITTEKADELDSKEIMKTVKEIIKNTKDLLIIDSRNHIICFVINAENDEKEACNLILSFIKNNISRFVPRIKMAVTFGGPLSFFDSMKNQTTKSRCVGKCYDCAKMMLNYAEIGVPMITKDIYEKSGCDISSMEFVEKKIAFDITIMTKA